MRRIIFLVALLGSLVFSNSNVMAQKKPKVLDSSEKKEPDWINGLEAGYIIVTASSNELEDAQKKALAKVKEHVISSVAENIQTESDYFRSEVSKNNNSEFSESLKTATKTRAANVPFIKGISASNVSAYYWAKVQDNSGTKYYYHIKYPFSKMELKKLIMEFEKMDRELTERLESASAKIEILNSIEDYSKLVKELEAVEEAFIDVDPRKNKAQAAISTVKQMLKDVSVSTVNNTLGEIRVVLVMGEKTITTTRKPTVKSNCAKIIEIKSNSPEWIIEYSYDECYDDSDNKVTVEFKSPYGRAENEYFFNVNADKVDVFVNNDLNITEGNVFIPITSKYASPFIVEKVILNFGKEAPIIIDGLNQQFEGEGKHELNVAIDSEIDTTIYSAKNYPMIKGTIHYRSVKSGEKSIYKIYNQKITTAW